MTRDELVIKIRAAEKELEVMQQLKEDLGDNRYAVRLLEHSKRHLYYLKRKLEQMDK